MVKREMVALLASTALISLATGCAMQRANDAMASLTVSDASRPAVAREFVGTWNGWLGPAGGADGGGGNTMLAAMTLEIKDDGTYRLISTRRGRGDAAGTASTDAGVVVTNGRTVTLRSPSGQWIPLTRKGNALYGVSKHLSGYTVQMTLERGTPVEAP